MRILVSWTPDARKFTGAREQAVAVGLLAHSLYRQNPPESEPTFAQLRACARGIRDHSCVVGARDRALRRMILIGQYADKALFDQLVARARDRRESGAPSQYTDGFEPPEPARTPDLPASPSEGSEPSGTMVRPPL